MLDSYSYSHFSTMLTCLRKFKYIAIDKLQVPDNENFAFGRALHAGLEACLKGEDAQLLFRMFWDTYQDDEIFDNSRHGWGGYAEMGSQFLAKFSKFYAPKMRLIESEKRLYGGFEGIKLEGTPDAIVEYEGKTTLIDFKTSGYNYHEDRALSSLQLNLYAYLALQTGIDVKQLAYVVFNKGTGSIQKPVIEEFNLDKCKETLNEMRQYISKMSSSSLFPKNPNSCIMGNSRCEFYDKCWKGKQ